MVHVKQGDEFIVDLAIITAICVHYFLGVDWPTIVYDECCKQRARLSSRQMSFYNGNFVIMHKY